ncbi:MAG: LytTR family DNA-binding domain-containing protein [Lachnospiraceae bacterium]|nr:LytTR family DNA-binding domain-containing protein [Lachnospiraceae bacterium]
MRMRRIAICCNAFLIGMEIEALCCEFFGQHTEIFHFEDGRDFIRTVDKRPQKFNIYFIDFCMYGCNGVEIREYLEEKRNQTPVIFIMDGQDNLRHAFGKNVFGCIMETVERNMLFALLKRVSRYEYDSRAYIMKDIYNRPFQVYFSDIMWIAADKNYTQVYLQNNASVLVHRTLKNWLEDLDSHIFFRVHKSYIVDFAYVSSVDTTVKMCNRVSLPIARDKRILVREQFLRYKYYAVQA